MADKIKTAMSCQLALQAENRTLLDFIRLVELEGDPNFFVSVNLKSFTLNYLLLDIVSRRSTAALGSM